MKIKYKVKIRWDDFIFDNVEEALIFAQSALMHYVSDDDEKEIKSIDIAIIKED